MEMGRWRSLKCAMTGSRQVVCVCLCVCVWVFVCLCMCLCVRPQFLNLRARGSDICKPRNNCIAGPNSPLQSQKQLREYKSYLSWFAFYQRGLSGQRSNHAPFCMKGELFTRHFIRLDTTKLQTDADFISCLSMCSDLDKSPCVQNDRTKRTRRAPVPY